MWGVGGPALPTVKFGRIWWAQLDSNQRPDGYEPLALTPEPQARHERRTPRRRGPASALSTASLPAGHTRSMVARAPEPG